MARGGPVSSGAKRWLWRLGIGAGIGALLLAGALYGLWWLVDARTYQVAGDLVWRVETAEPVVALTFDDGPEPDRVEPLLTLLHDLDVKATFFVIGESLAASPESGRRLVQAGHQLGNHSYTHDRMIFRSGDFYSREIEQTDAQIRAVGFEGPIVFRPPFTKKLVGLPLYLARTGRTSVTWDIEPDSDIATAGSAEKMTAAVLAAARPGSIVLLHPWYDSRGETMRAIGPIVSGLRQRGFRLVTVNELLGLRAAT
jgi:peptidoglycan/xylan/chitin deacetylase (PgdA/CDA1 family)